MTYETSYKELRSILRLRAAPGNGRGSFSFGRSKHPSCLAVGDATSREMRNLLTYLNQRMQTRAFAGDVFSMSIDHPKVADQPSLVAEMREIIEETRKTIEASQVILDRCTASTAEAPVKDLAEHLAEQASADVSLLEGIADGLIVAYEYAKLDNDPLTLALIEKAMLHVGRRLARAIGPKQAGLACH